MDLFSSCGQVVNFRLVYDKETGQPKGFGFLEYTDMDAAASAVRNLNEHDLNGRTLRVDYSNDNRGTSNQNSNQPQNQDTNRAPPPAHFAAPTNGARPDLHALPPLPPGVDLPQGVSAIDAISRTINNITTPQLIDFITQVKGLCSTNPAQATTLLNSHPPLAYAVFQAMLLLDFVDANIVQQLVATAPPPVQAQPPPQAQPLPMPSQAYPPQIPQGYPPGYGAPPPQTYAPTPPQQHTYQAPPQPTPTAPPQQAPAPDQQALIAQVLALSRETILAMPEPAKSQITALRAQYGAPI
jgi:cleavage stimulation factor subunit 2